MIKILCFNLGPNFTPTTVRLLIPLGEGGQDQRAVITAGRSRLLPLPSIPSPVPSVSLHPFSLFARPCVRPSISRSIIALGKLSLSRHRHRRPQLALSLAAQQTGFLPFLCCSSQFDPMKAIDTLTLRWGPNSTVYLVFHSYSFAARA